MKNIFSILFFVAALVFLPVFSQAGIAINKQMKPICASCESAPCIKLTTPHNHVLDTDSENETPKKQRSGVIGILSLCFSIIGVVAYIWSLYWFGFLIDAWALYTLAGVVLGIIGMGERRKLKGLAIAGFVLGVSTILFALFSAPLFYK